MRPPGPAPLAQHHTTPPIFLLIIRQTPQGKDAAKAGGAGGDDKGDGDGSGADAAEPPPPDSDGAVAADKDEGEDDADAMDEGPADTAAAAAGVAAGGQASKDGYLLQAEDLKADDLASRTGQLDVMLEYLWQVRPPLLV